jgi:hypothetical protein
MELHNKDLSDWNTNYLANMAEASRLKSTHRVYTDAKKNAEFLVWGTGIGGIGVRPPGATAPTPIDMFCGDSLFELYTGVNRKKTLAGKKHDRDSGIDEATEGEARRVRPRTENDDDESRQIGRAEGGDEGMFPADDEEVELPRDAPAALDDQQLFSAMPWNMSASVRGSSAVPRSARVGLPGSVAGSMSTTAKASALRQRGGRLVSASPLQGRGTLGDSDILRGFEAGDTDVEMEGLALPEMISSDGGFLAGDVAAEEIAASAQRVTESLSAEGGNFLAFIADAVEQKQQRAQQERDPFQEETAADNDTEEVLFEDLLPPQENGRMVACQGLMMVLALGTRGLLDVRQDEPFQVIGLKLTKKGRESHMRVVEAAGAKEGAGGDAREHGSGDDGDDAAMGVEGEFEELMAAAVGGDTDEESEDEDDDGGNDDDDNSDFEG